MKVKDQSPTVVVVDVSREMKSNDDEARRGGGASETSRPAPPRRSMHYDGKQPRILVFMGRRQFSP